MDFPFRAGYRPIRPRPGHSNAIESPAPATRTTPTPQPEHPATNDAWSGIRPGIRLVNIMVPARTVEGDVIHGHDQPLVAPRVPVLTKKPSKRDSVARPPAPVEAALNRTPYGYPAPPPPRPAVQTQPFPQLLQAPQCLQQPQPAQRPDFGPASAPRYPAANATHTYQLPVYSQPPVVLNSHNDPRANAYPINYGAPYVPPNGEYSYASPGLYPNQSQPSFYGRRNTFGPSYSSGYPLPPHANGHLACNCQSCQSVGGYAVPSYPLYTGRSFSVPSISQGPPTGFFTLPPLRNQKDMAQDDNDQLLSPIREFLKGTKNLPERPKRKKSDESIGSGSGKPHKSSKTNAEPMTPPFSGPHPPPSEGKGVSIWAKPLTPPFDAVAPASRASVSSYRPPSASTQPIQSAPVWQPPAVSVSLSSPIPVQPSQPDLDNCDQRIVEDYEDYHRSVLLYTMAENVNGSAAIALEQHFNSQGINFRVPWVSHTTIGYICEGTPRTFIVLHNAFNPFAYDTKNTTTIGFFVASPYVFSEINWKTYDISMINFFKQCENGGMIQVTRAWNKSMPKAVDRKYHRAYWLAAGRKPLKALLNRAAPGYPKECEPIPESLQETDEDVFTGVGDDFEFEVPLTLWETEQKWNEILNHPCQRPDWKWDDSVEWMLTGSSEM